ncbi:MAG: hypothetical protein WC707_03095 [Candidatus Babeliaceae bacterium]|jgi:hypothetical protein
MKKVIILSLMTIIAVGYGHAMQQASYSNNPQEKALSDLKAERQVQEKVQVVILVHYFANGCRTDGEYPFLRKIFFKKSINNCQEMHAFLEGSKKNLSAYDQKIKELEEQIKNNN